MISLVISTIITIGTHSTHSFTHSLDRKVTETMSCVHEKVKHISALIRSQWLRSFNCTATGHRLLLLQMMIKVKDILWSGWRRRSARLTNDRQVKPVTDWAQIDRYNVGV